MQRSWLIRAGGWLWAVTGRGPRAARRVVRSPERLQQPSGEAKCFASSHFFHEPSWICNLLGAKQVNNGPVSDKGITADRCAKCANPLVGSQSPTHCLRCKTLSSTVTTRARDYTGSKFTGRRVHQAILGAQRVGRTSILKRKHLPPVRDVRGWCTARIDASTVTSTAICTNAPCCYLQ